MAASCLFVFALELSDNFVHLHYGILLPDHLVLGLVALVLVHCDYFILLLLAVLNLFAQFRDCALQVQYLL